MFYSHEILTSREHGVATVWLVATLGSKSSSQKVNRKAIMGVDVQKACNTVIRPEAPMALRLQGNLLYGISKVFDQQCGYALVDVQTMRDRMRTIVKELKLNTGLDPDAGKAKRDQLVLPDDPTFVPTAVPSGADMDMSIFNFFSQVEDPPAEAGRGYIQSSELHTSNNQSPFSDRNLDAGGAPSSSVAAGNEGIKFPVGSDMPGSLYADEKGVLLQPDFEIDAEGNIIDLPPVPPLQEDISRPPTRDRDLMDDFQLDVQGREEDLGILDDQPNATGERDPNETSTVDQHRSILDPDYEPQLDQENGLETSSLAQAQQQNSRGARRRGVKPLDIDLRPELKNSDLAQWNTQYVHNMTAARQVKINNKINAQAKKNADFWVLGKGLGSVGVGIGTDGQFTHPLSRFSGQHLLASLIGTITCTGGNNREKTPKPKRGHAETALDEDDLRNVRPKLDNHPPDLGNDLGQDRYNDQEIEMGRRAPSSLADHELSSHMPWNITASIHGSSHPGSSVHSRHIHPSLDPYSANMPSSVLASHSRHRSGRLTSASPLAGRGSMLNDILKPGDEDDLDYAMEHDLGSAGPIGEGGFMTSEGDCFMGNQNKRDDGQRPPANDSLFELYGPAAGVDTQTAAESQWLKAVLDQESLNFLGFMRSRLEENEVNIGKGKAPMGSLRGREISFSSLLPPQTNTRLVATQALLHVLTLATRSALNVRQEKSEAAGTPMGEILMSCVA